MPLRLPDRRRATSFALALAVEALILLALLLWSPRLTPRAAPDRRPATFSLITAKEDQAATSPAHRARAKAAAAASAAEAHATPSPPVVPPLPGAFTLPGVLPITLGAKNIGKLKSSAVPSDYASSGDQSDDGQEAYGPGLGPGGMPYYYADWYRKPTDAEVFGYLKKRPLGRSRAVLFCQTIARYHVDHCRLLQESPAGSGFGHAIQQAAWQLLVRPPRRGGKDLVGAWVGIVIELNVREVRASGGAPDPDPADASGADPDR